MNMSHADFVEKQRKAKALRRQIAATIRSLDAGLTKLWRKELSDRMPELLLHAQHGRGFKIHIEVVTADGKPFEPDPEAPKVVSPEKTIILLDSRR